MSLRKEDALDYHAKGRPGKIEVIPTKETQSQRDLSLAYSPGVAEPCLEITKNIEDVYKYTAKGNLVAVISNGTAVLGLGDIGPEASKPVMEGKGVLFKIFADIDVFDLELNTKDTEEIIRTVKILEPTFGGINLEDIKAPECFEIEERLKKELNIPVMHDDQHGTAIISGAALINALEIAEKDISKAKFVFSGAGSAAISCAKLYILLGAKKENFWIYDSKGLVHHKRTDLDKQKQFFIQHSDDVSLEEALKNCDVFIGLSKGNLLTPEMLLGMAKNPIVFAMANPTPEIDYNAAKQSRNDIIVATGRSDFPNQVNNVLGFPFIFRGALDVRASAINEEMKLAATKALAELAKKNVPDIVNLAYNEKNLSFGKEYIIPKPVDPRLITTVAPAVARAAMESGVARKPILDWDNYETELSKRLGLDNTMTKAFINRARKNRKRIVFTDAENIRVLKAVQQVIDDEIAEPILLGNIDRIQEIVNETRIDIRNTQIIDPRARESREKIKEYSEVLYEKLKRKGLNKAEAYGNMLLRSNFAAMMVERGDADAMISGLTRDYPDTIRPALQIIGRKEGVNRLVGMHILFTKYGVLFFSDTTINFNPTVQELVGITELTAQTIQNQFNITPRIALLSYSNFGSAKGDDALKMKKASAILQEKYPQWIVEGEMQAQMALNSAMTKENYPFSKLGTESANTLIFPTLSAANISYNLAREISGVSSIGPILLGLKKPVHILQNSSSVSEIVNMVAIAAVEAGE